MCLRLCVCLIRSEYVLMLIVFFFFLQKKLTRTSNQVVSIYVSFPFIFVVSWVCSLYPGLKDQLVQLRMGSWKWIIREVEILLFWIVSALLYHHIFRFVSFHLVRFNFFFFWDVTLVNGSDGMELNLCRLCILSF